MKNIVRLLASGLVAAVLALAAHAAELAPGAYSVGRVTGDVTYKLAGSSEYLPLAAGTALPQGATIKTGANSSAVVVFASGSVASITAGSEVEITKFQQEVFAGPIPVDSEPAVSNTEIKVINGAVTNKVNKLKKGSSYTVNTPVGAAGVRGTTFRVSYDTVTGAYSIQVVEGGVVVNTIKGESKAVGGGQQLRSDKDGAWELSELPPAVQAAIIADINGAFGSSGISGRPAVEAAIEKIDVTAAGQVVSPD